MDIILDKVYKRYTTGWVLKDISCQLDSGQTLAIVGPNGSGKSTLFQIFAGYLTHTKGKVKYKLNGVDIKRDDVYKYLAISAAYAELDEELTVKEIFEHYRKFKPFLIKGVNEFLQLSDFSKEANKQIRTFSSGMKQRLNLALAFSMDLPVLLLDEPTSFLDKSRIDWYHSLLENYTKGKTVIIATNDSGDYKKCDKVINLGA